MQIPSAFRRIAGLLAVGGLLQFAGTGPAGASVISATPTLPVLGVPYKPVVGGGCFTLAGVCIDLGSLTMTSLVSSMFSSTGQDIVADAGFTGLLTTLSGTPIGPISLSGTIDEEVVGRTFSTGLGSWTTDVTTLSLTGPVLGHTLTVGLNPLDTSSGTSSIVSVGGADNGPFRISSFFDVFIDLNLNSIPPLTTTRGPIRVVLAMPEPASLALIVPALFGLIAAGRRRG